MNKVKKRESIIAVTYLIISFISPIALACIFYSYTINGNKFKYLSALEGGIIITVLFFSTLIAFGFFIHHLLRVLKLDKKVLNKNLISWKYSDAEWKAFVYRETKRRFIDTLKLLKKMFIFSLKTSGQVRKPYYQKNLYFWVGSTIVWLPILLTGYYMQE